MSDLNKTKEMADTILNKYHSPYSLYCLHKARKAASLSLEKDDLTKDQAESLTLIVDTANKVLDKWDRFMNAVYIAGAITVAYLAIRYFVLG